MTPLERSNRSKKSWRSRKRVQAARETLPVGYDRIMAATTPDKSSAVIAKELGLNAAYVRVVWKRMGQPPRAIGKRPKLCASSQGPTNEPS